MQLVEIGRLLLDWQLLPFVSLLISIIAATDFLEDLGGRRFPLVFLLVLVLPLFMILLVCYAIHIFFNLRRLTSRNSLMCSWRLRAFYHCIHRYVWDLNIFNCEIFGAWTLLRMPLVIGARLQWGLLRWSMPLRAHLAHLTVPPSALPLLSQA
jgi:hypothetical protein